LKLPACENCPELIRLREENALLRLENEGQKARLNLNSTNSSKPPSSDGLRNPRGKERSLREKTGRKPGGQVGHPGKTLIQADTPDEVVACRPETCAHCGEPLDGVHGGDDRRRQVFEVPAPRPLVVTEYLEKVVECPHCRHRNRGGFPAGVKAAAQYGPGFNAEAVFLTHGNMVSISRAAEILNERYACNVSQGTICKIHESCQASLPAWTEQVKAMLRVEDFLFFDETSLKVDKALRWLHSAGSEFLTLLTLHKKRGKEGTEASGVMPGYAGTATHDCWKSYFSYESCEHNICRAHLLRELKELTAFAWLKWPAPMMKWLLDVKKAVEEARAKGMKALAHKRRDAFVREYDRILAGAFEQTPVKTKSYPVKKSFNLASRLKERRALVLSNIFNTDVPFDNNQAERDVRRSKVKQKVSGCFRSVAGAEQYAVVESYLSTARKNGMGQLAALTALFKGQPFIPMRN